MAAAKKANYIKSLGKPEAAAGWHFLTSSDPSAAKTLGDAIGFGFRLNPETGQYLHRPAFISARPRAGYRGSKRASNTTPKCSATR